MAAVAFDTHKYIKSLEEAGVPLLQAEAQAKVLAEAIDVTLATKQDLQNVKSELMVEIANTKTSLIMWIVGLLIGQTGILFWVINRLIH